MSITRAPHDKNHPYVMLSKSVAKIGLSPEALATWFIIMCKPNGWKIIPKLLAKEVGVGNNKIYRVLNELKASKLCEYKETKIRGKDGRWLTKETEYIIHETPRENASTDTFDRDSYLHDFGPQQVLENNDLSNIDDDKAKANNNFKTPLCSEKQEFYEGIKQNMPKGLISDDRLFAIVQDYPISKIKNALQAVAKDHKKGQQIYSYEWLIRWKLGEKHPSREKKID